MDPAELRDSIVNPDGSVPSIDRRPRVMLQPRKDTIREALARVSGMVEKLKKENAELRAQVTTGDKVFAVGFFSGVAVSIVVRWMA